MLFGFASLNSFSYFIFFLCFADNFLNIDIFFSCTKIYNFLLQLKINENILKLYLKTKKNNKNIIFFNEKRMLN